MKRERHDAAGALGAETLEQPVRGRAARASLRREELDDDGVLRAAVKRRRRPAPESFRRPPAGARRTTRARRARESGPRRRIVTNKAVAGNIHLKPDLYDHYLRAMSAAPPGILPVIAVDRTRVEAALPAALRRLPRRDRRAAAARRDSACHRRAASRPSSEISRIPVLNAFEQLLAEGYFESRTGSGTFVASALPERPRSRPPRARSGPRRRNRRRERSRRMAAELRRAGAGPWFRGRGAFSVGEPALDRFPLSRLVEPRRSPRPASGSGTASTTAIRWAWRPLREAVAEYLRTARAVRCEADQIMIVNGSQQALELAARVLLDLDSPVWIEEPGYFGLHRVAVPGGRAPRARAGRRPRPRRRRRHRAKPDARARSSSRRRTSSRSASR